MFNYNKIIRVNAVVSCTTEVLSQVLIEIIINRKCFRILTILGFLSNDDEIARLCILSTYALGMDNLSRAWIAFQRHELLHQLNLTLVAAALDDYSSSFYSMIAVNDN